MKNWVLLEHTGALDDPKGIHFDLLLEDGDSCRTWRLDAIPVLDGPALHVIPLPPHNLAWLEKQDALVSGGRGRARRIKSGSFQGELPVSPMLPVQIVLNLSETKAYLEIHNGFCKLCSLSIFN